MIAGPPGCGKGTQCAKIVDKVLPLPLPNEGFRHHIAAQRANIRCCVLGTLSGAGATLCRYCVTLTARRNVQYGLNHISVGDLLREQVEDGTPAGLKAKEFMDSGNLVPDDVVVEMVVATLDTCKSGWLLDGYPRSASQAQALEAVGIRPDVVLLITVPDEAIVDRVIGRRLDPETGDIYHMTFKPPPAAIVDRLKQVRATLCLMVDACQCDTDC